MLQDAIDGSGDRAGIADGYRAGDILLRLGRTHRVNGKLVCAGSYRPRTTTNVAMRGAMPACDHRLFTARDGGR